MSARRLAADRTSAHALRHVMAWLLGALVALLTLGVRGEPARSTPATDSRQNSGAAPQVRASGEVVLLSGTTQHRFLSAGDTHAYRVDLASGEAVELSMQQLGTAGVELLWRARDMAPLALRTAAGREATVSLPLLTDSPRTWEIELTVTDPGGTGEYALTLSPAHASTADDRARSAATEALAQAEALKQASKSSPAAVRALYRKSLQSSQSGHDACGARRDLLALSAFEHDIGNTEAQKRAAQAALEQPCAADLAEQALAGRILGSAYINEGDYALGVRATEHAVALFRRTQDVRQESLTLRNLGLAYAESGELDKALETTHAALKIAETLKDERSLALLHNDIAFMHSARGEFALAVDGYRQALEGLRKTPFPMAESVAWINLGFAYGELGDVEQGMAAFAKAEPAATQAQCWSCLSEIEVDRADVLFDHGEIAPAEAAYRHAREIADAHQLVRQRAEALRGLGRCALQAQRWGEARTLLQASLHELQGTGGRLNESVVYVALGDLEARLGHDARARHDYERALRLAREAANQAWQAVAHASLARLAQQAGNLEAAQRSIERAIALIESERTRISAPDLRTSYFGTKRAYYDLDVDILMRLDHARPAKGYAGAALVAAERARARALQDQLAERAIGVDAGKAIDAGLLAAESSAADRLRALAYQLSQTAASDAAHRQTLEGQIDEASRTLNEARGRIRAANPRYAELTHPNPLSVGEIQSQLVDDGATVLEYWLGERQSYLWVITHEALHAFALPARTLLEASAESLRQSLLAPTRTSTSTPIEQRAAQEQLALSELQASATVLARELLPGEARQLLRPTIAVVPDGALQSLPFIVLQPVAESSATAQYVYLPSLSTLRTLRSLPPATAPPTALAAIADPVFRLDDERLHGRPAEGRRETQVLLLRAASEVGIVDLPRLPHTREEAQAITALADRRSWTALDFAANRKAVLAAPWGNYALVHFATHALLNTRHPELSGIVLSMYDAAGHPQDGFLRANDIYNLHMPAELVVLSVCDSAVGKDVGAEGPANLARAFFYAGARRVVASLWPVGDRAAATFMKSFYGALLAKHDSPVAALHAAQQSLARDPRWKAPYYWAGFVLEGDWR